MLPLVELVILAPFAALATWQTVETWAQGSIFERPRAWMQARQGLLSDLLLCAYCLSHWVAAAWAILVFVYVSRCTITWELMLLPMYTAAIARMAVAAHDFIHKTRNFERNMLSD
jgi:hypothetical protein